MTGQRLGRFRVVDRIGAAAGGDVYRARDEQLERDVMLVVLPAASIPDAAARARLLRDAQAASRLNHPYICTIHEVGETGASDPFVLSLSKDEPGSAQAGSPPGDVFVAMEWVEGQPLSARLAEGPLRPDELLRYGLQLTEALAHAHEHHVVHGDLRSSDVVVTPDGRVKVLGFGLARPQGHAGVTEARAAMRAAPTTPPEQAADALAYLAPEQLRGQPADPRSDVWALGVLLHEMASGQRPFRGATVSELSSAILNATPSRLPASVPAELQAVIERSLRKEPGQRYRRASEVYAALEAVQSSTALPRRDAGKAGWVPRRWLAVGATALVLGALGAALYLGAQLGRRQAPVRAPAPMLHALAVLPLANLSGDPGQQYVADGLTDALIDDLAKVVRVISRTSTAGYALAPKPIKQIARELNVDAVVEGSVAREGNLVRVTAALIDAATERRLWSDRYERNLTSILALQADIARAVARSIKGTLSPEEERKLQTTREVNPQVWEAYQQGMYLLNQSTPDALKKGMDLLHQAIEKDPTEALAYAGLADGYITLAHGADPSPDALFRAKAAAQTALELDPSLPQAIFALGVIRGYHEWDWTGGEQELRRALELNPSFAMAHYQLAWFLAIEGRIPEAIVEHIRARDADPVNPLHTAWLGELYRLNGEPDKAIAEAEKAMQLAPDFPASLFVVSLVYAEQAKWENAVETMRRLSENDPDFRWALGAMCAAAGRTAEARRILAELNAQPVDPWGALWRAVIHAALGERDAAFEWAKHEPHHPWLPCLVMKEWEFYTKSLVDDPRYEELRRRMNVPKWHQ